MVGAGESGHVVIVGAGHAGGELAAALRMEGYAGAVTLVGEEPYLPYQRPPLSKTFLAGDTSATALYLRPEPTYAKHSIATMLGTRVERIDRTARRVHLADGQVLAYTKLALATGGRPRPLPHTVAGDAHGCSNLHYLRTIADIDRLRAQFIAGARVVIVGGGYIGLEVASVATKRGLKVTVLEALPRVLARVTAPELSVFYERVHREAGVDVRTSAAVAGFDVDGARHVIRGVIVGGETIPADLVIVGIGLVPNVELAAAAGLEVNDGIVVDEYAATADPDVYAAGDCTNHPNRALARTLRLESVPNAVEQARTAAANIAGKRKVYETVPWFWSDQYELKLQMVGLSAGYDELVIRGSTSNRSFAAFYVGDGRVIAADVVSRPEEFMVAKRLVASRAVVDRVRLADESQPLKALLG